MKRIEKLKEQFSYFSESHLIETLCPYDIDKELENCDKETLRLKHEPPAFKSGCRGITCEECWDKELY